MMIGDIQQSDIGRKVVYKAHDGHIEEGIITSFSSAHVFVRYGNSTCAQATIYDQLEFMSPTPTRSTP